MSHTIPPQVIRAFFTRFGGKPRVIQEEAFKSFLEDRDGLVVAPTSSGKTEAVFVPVATRLLARGAEARGRLGALIISPTRALATDLHKRMSPTFQALGLRLDAATGDLNTCSRIHPSDALIRTPEGLDGTLCRHQEQVGDIQDVVIDEMHLFLCDPRGTQLVGLLHRLLDLAPGHRRLGISATLPDPTLPVRVGLLRAEPILVTAEDQGEIQFIQHAWMGQGPHGVDSFLATLRDLPCRKAIAFVRSRARAEEASAMLNRGHLKGHCFVHHGATSTALRREAEERLRRERVALVVATTTLEVGIDIGDLDTTILLDVPNNTGSLLQRAGRAGRRNGLRRVLYVTGLYDRAVDFSQVITLARRPQEPRRGDARPYLAGCFQQIASLVAARGSASRPLLRQFLTAAYGLPEVVGERMIDCLLESGLLMRHGADLGLSAPTQKMMENRSIHMTFSGQTGSPVIDEVSRQHIGHAAVHGNGTILLGGKGREVTGRDPRTQQIVTRTVEGGIPSFAPLGQSSFESAADRFMLLIGGRLVQ
jgi:ATP-dependent Lhr-like helicase